MSELGERRDVLGRDGSRSGEEQPIELRRHLAAVRRSRLAIVLFVLASTLIALGVSLYLPKSYTARATIVREEVAGLLNSPGVEEVDRELQTIERLITTPTILDQAAARIGRDRETLEKRVSASVSSDTNIIGITATASTAESAALFANAVANAFLAKERADESRRLALARARLLEELARLRRSRGSALEIEALQSRLSELSVQEAAVGSELQLAQAAEPPDEPSSPRPVRNAVLAFFAALVLGILGALAREQLVPRVGGPRDVGRLFDLPVIGGIPLARRRFRGHGFMTAGEFEAYQTLQSTVRFQLPPDQQRVLLITSTVPGEGKTTVTANLGRALARAGERTLLVSADLRRPKLHELLDVRPGPGLTELLISVEKASTPERREALAGRITRMLKSSGNLVVLPTGEASPEGPRALFTDALPIFLQQVRKADFSYVLIDSPPLLGIADSQVLARHADGVLMIARPDRLTLDQLIDARDLLERLEIVPLGLVVVGTKRETSYYYGRGVPSIERT